MRVDSRLIADRLEVRVSGDVAFVPFAWDRRGLDWDLRLTNEVPLSLELETGANQSTVDLSNLRVASVKLKTGASSTDLTHGSLSIFAFISLGFIVSRLRSSIQRMSLCGSSA